MKNAADEKSPGHVDRARLQSRRRLRAHARPSRLATLAAEAAQHALGVIARERRLDHGRAPSRVEPREQHGGLHLRAGDRQRVVDAAAALRRRAIRTGGRPSSVSIRAPIARSGSATRSIGRCISDSSPISTLSNACAREQSHEEPHGRARIAHVERAARRRSPCSPTPCTRTSLRARSLDRARPALAARASVARQSSLSRKPATSVRPSAMPPSISARCEIDLSPGTRIARRTPLRSRLDQRSARHRDCSSSIAAERGDQALVLLRVPMVMRR